MNLPNARHRRHAELDELIAATNTRRAPDEARTLDRTQHYANLDDEYDRALARVAQRQVPARCPRCGVVGNGSCCAGVT